MTTTATSTVPAAARPAGAYDRVFYTTMAVTMAATVFVGFSPSYYLRLFDTGPQTTVSGGPFTTLVHLHGAIFTAWVLLFVLQTALVASRRVATHRLLGVAGVVLAAAMVVVGTSTALATAARGGAPVGIDPIAFLAIPLTDMVLFAGFVTSAVILRRNREAHKRLMLLAYASILVAAVARMPGVLPLGPLGFFALTFLFIVAGVIYDWLSRGRVHRVYLIGGAIFAISVTCAPGALGHPGLARHCRHADEVIRAPTHFSAAWGVSRLALATDTRSGESTHLYCMKILYIAHERRAAEAAAQALRSIAPDVTLSWARSPGIALGWIQGNRDVRAVIVDAGTQNQGCNVLLDQVRRLGTTIPVAVIAPDHLDGLLHALKPGRDAVVERERTRNGLLEAQLREVEDWRQQVQQRLADRQAQHDAALARAGRISTALQERLLELEASLHSADERHSAQAAALGQLARREIELGAVATENAALRAAAEQRLADSEHAHRQAQERAAADLTAAAGRQAALETHLGEEQAARSTLEARLAATELARQDAERRHAAELAALTARLDDADAQHRAASVRSNRICTGLQDRLLELETALGRAEQRHAADTARTERLESRETELSDALAAATAALDAVERDLADTRTTLQDAQQRAVAERTTATERCVALEEQLHREADRRAMLAAEVAAARDTHEAADRQHEADRVAWTTCLADLQVQYDASVARADSLAQQVTDAAAALEQARGQWQAELAEAAGRLASREAELSDALAASTAALDAVERNLADTRTTLQDAQQRAAADRTTATERCVAFEEQLHREADTRAMLAAELTAARDIHEAADRRHEADRVAWTTCLADLQVQYDASVARADSLAQQVTDAAAALEQARGRWQTELAEAAERQASRETELGGALAAATAALDTVERNLAATRTTLQDTQQRAAADRTTATERYVALEEQLHREVDVRATLAAKLTAARDIYESADRQHAADLVAWTTSLDDVQAQHDASVARAESLAQQVTDAAAALEQARGQWQAQLAEAAERLASRETELSGALTAASDARTALEREFADARAAHHDAELRLAADLAVATARAAALENRLNQEIAARTSLEAQLAAAATARENVETRHATERAAWTTRLAELHGQYDASVERAESLAQQVTDATAALEQARGQWQSEVAAAAERLASRETELSGALAVANDARAAVERELADAQIAHYGAEQRLAADFAASSARAAALEERLNQEIQARTSLEAQVAAAATAREKADKEHATERTTLSARLTVLQAQYDASVDRIRSLEQEATGTAAALEQARGQWRMELTEAAERLASRETELSGALSVANGARTSVEKELADARAAHHDAHQRFAADLAESTARSAALEARLNKEIGARVALQERFSQERALTVSLQDSLLQIEESSRLAIEASARDTARVQQEADRLRRQLDAMRAHAATLRRDVERLPMLQLRFDESQKENRRQFERAPYGLCECTPDGAITRVNHSMARLLGYRSGTDLQRADFAATVFECADDLRWLLERAVETGKPQSVETLLKTRGHGRLNVRLHAMSADRTVVIAVEDLTKLNAVEQRLREAQRLEAVGRVASEVAVTCDNLLRDVTRGGHQWLAGLESDTSMRNQGELLLGDVTRAAGFLRQFAVYGNKEISSLEPVSVPRVLREMEPILKRVLGNEISLTLPKPAAGLFEVDVDSETVRRIFVNVANYARGRMHGGRVKIDLATAVVDQRFLAKHPEVRPGAHVVITIKEIQGPARPALPMHLPADRDAHPPAIAPSIDKPGMDLGTFVALISDLGGHLWMSAEPGGNLTLQIHIPKRISDDETETMAAGAKVSRGRQFARWFRQ